MNKLYRSMLLSGILAAGLAGCGDDVTVVDPPAPVPPTPQVRSVTVAPDNVQVSPGQTIQMSAAVTADSGATPTVTWSTSDATRATVNGTGLVTIVANAPSGPVAIRATATANNSSASGVATLNVVGTTVTGVTITPATATLNAGTSLSAPQTVQLSAAVQGTNNPAQTVTWSSLDAAIATVSASGVVTANNTATPGNVVIKACSTVNTSVCGTMALTVIVPSPASVQVQAVTFNSGGNVVPVALTNVFGQIEISLNVEPGARNITRVDALIGGQVVATQTFTSAAAEAAAPETAPTTIVLSTNTAQVRQSGGIFVPVIFNGNSAITANLYVAGSSTPIASNAVPVVMNNPDALIRTSSASLTPTSNTPSAVSLNDGNTYYKGSQTTGGFHYVAFGKAVPATATLNSDVCGASNNLVPGSASATGGIALGGTFTCATGEGGNDITGVAGTTYAAGAVGPDGTPLTPPAGISTVGSAFQLNGESRWNMIFPAVGPNPGSTWVDNVAPAVTIQSGAVGVGPAVAFNDLMDQQWVNASYAFAQDMGAVDGGGLVGTGVASGFPKAREYTSVCGATNLPTQTGDDFSPTLTSVSTDGKRICTYAEDLLGNANSSGPSNYFGVDKTAPSVRLAGSTAATPTIAPSTLASVSSTANTTIYGNVGFGSPFTAMPATDVWGLEAIDDRAGFNQNAISGLPATQSLARLAQSGATSCSLFTSPLNQPLSDVWIRTNPALVALDCALATGYYTYTGYVTDRAGNRSSTIARNFARDEAGRPTVTGFTATNLPYQPGAIGGFSFFALDDLEVIAGTIAVSVPIQPTANPAGTPVGTALRYPLGSVQGLGTKWDATLTGIITNGVASVSYMFFRIDETCSGVGVPYAGCPAAPVAGFPYITAPKTTVSANYNWVAGAADSLQLPTGASGNVADVADQLAAAPATTPFLRAFFNPMGVSEPWTAAPNLLGFDVDLTSSPGSAIAKEIGITSVTVPFFEGVQLFRVNTAFEWVLCGDFPAPVSQDNGPHRVWNYTLAVPTTGPCTGATFAAGASYRALGRKSGAGLFTPTR